VARYYRALNNTLNHDIDGPALRSVIPLVGAMLYDLCCFVDGTPRRFEQDTRVWKVSGSVLRAPAATAVRCRVTTSVTITALRVGD
jgi:hypothetical protein